MKNDTQKIIVNRKIGAHLSVAGGYTNALDKIVTIGGNCLQIFSSSPRSWSLTTTTSEQIDAFNQRKKELGIGPIYFHASYLINLADNDRIGKFSKLSLIAELELAEKLGVEGTIIHLGSFKSKESIALTIENYTTLFTNIQEVLDKTPETTKFIIENAGNRKICCDLKEMAFIIRELHNPRIRVCLDTCHLHGGGYDLSTDEKFDAFFTDFDEKIGLSKLEVFQVNDSKDSLGSFRDRHENIGEGTIPSETFKLLINDLRTRDIPFILETPGFDKKGPDKKNVDLLKAYIQPGS